MKQLTAYLPDDVYATMTALAATGESVNSYVRAAVETENRWRMFAGMDDAISAVVGEDNSAGWHAANAEFVETRDDAP